MKKFFLVAAVVASTFFTACSGDNTTENWIIENKSPTRVEVKLDTYLYRLKQDEVTVANYAEDEPVISVNGKKYGFNGYLTYTKSWYYAEGRSYHKLTIAEGEKQVYEITNLNPAKEGDEDFNKIFYTDGITIDETSIDKVENYNGEEFTTYKLKEFSLNAGETVTKTFYTDYLYGRTPTFKFYINEGDVTFTKSYDAETGTYKILIPVQFLAAE